jgi:hypothetical protein
MSYNVRDPEVESKLRELSEHIGARLPEGWGFTLLLFSYGPDGNLFYMSSAEREDVVKVMKEWIARQVQ